MAYQSNNPFFVAPASSKPFAEGLAGISEGISKRRESKRENAETQRKQGIRQKAATALENDDTETLARLSIENEWIQEDLIKQQKFKNETTEASTLKAAVRIYMGEDAQDVLPEHISTVLKEDGDPSPSLYIGSQDKKGDKTIAKKEAAKTIIALKGGKYLNDLNKAMGGGEGVLPTDADDYLKDRNQQSIEETGKPLSAKKRADTRIAYKRAQKEEVRANKFAERNVEAATAEKIKYNTELGKQLALIETAADLTKARGEITPEGKKAAAGNRVTSKLATMTKYYSELSSMGAINNIEKGTMENIIASTRSSSLGQAFGKAIGSKPQSIRKKILNMKPLLVQDVRQATEMGARGMDSVKELEFYLQAVTNEKSDIQSNMAAIYVLDQTFGEGKLAELLGDGVDQQWVDYFTKAGAKINPTDPQRINNEPAQTNNRGWQLMEDDSGNKAYVNPNDTTQIEEVR